MTNCNSDILAQARANIAERQMPANGRAVLRGDWDAGSLVQNEIARLLREPVLTQGEEA